MRVHRGTILLAMGMALPLVLGCDSTDMDKVAPASMNEPLNAQQIVGFIAAVAQGEQQEAQIEVGRGSIAAAQQLAAQFIAEDDQAIVEVQEVTGVSPASSPEVTALTQGLVATSNVLAASSPPTLDIEWVCAQLEGQVNVLFLYDSRVIPSAMSAGTMTAVLVKAAEQGRAIAVAHQQATMQLASQLGITFSPQAGPGMTCVPPAIPPAPGPPVVTGD